MNYKKIYDSLIINAQGKQRTKSKDNYYENHHIKPKSFGGGNNKENLVLLTAKEHYIAHLLLVEMYTGKDRAKMSFALFQMCRKNKQHKRIVSARDFEKAKRIMHENCSGENGMFYGKTHTDEVKKMLSEKIRGENNPSIKYGVWNDGLTTGPLSEEHRKKISEAVTGFHHGDTAKEKISQTHKDKPKSIEHKKKISETLKGRPRDPEAVKRGIDKLRGKKQKILVCPHCGKEGGTAMHRWHFDNCKTLII